MYIAEPTKLLSVLVVKQLQVVRHAKGYVSAPLQYIARVKMLTVNSEGIHA